MKHSLVRETIIKTASNLFYQKGYNLTGINEIISESGIAVLSKQVYLIYESAIAESHLHQNEWPIKTAKGIIEKVLV